MGWKPDPNSMEGVFQIGWDEVRQLMIVGKFDEDGVMHTGYIQVIPDNFWDQNRHMGQEYGPLIGDTQRHARQVARIPDAIGNQWAEEDREVANDPDEKERRLKARLNSNEWSKLRVSEGKI